MNNTVRRMLSIGLLVHVLFVIPAIADMSIYNPLAVLSQVAPEIVDCKVVDDQRQRDIPIRVYLPQVKSPSPVILFSHGLGGSREGSAYLGKHWAARGYVAVFLQHTGSDISVVKDMPKKERRAAMREAANRINFMLRVKDVPIVLDQLERWNNSDKHVLFEKLNLKKIGMSGHSFGALTTQAVSGQSTIDGEETFNDPRIAAAVVMSPSSPRRGTPQAAFGKVLMPWLLMTGTKDIAPVGNASIESRLAVYPALPIGGKYELVLHGAEHSVFTERALPKDSEPRNPNHHRAILALTTAFWDSYLLNNSSAKDWLDGAGPRSILEKEDTWQMK